MLWKAVDHSHIGSHSQWSVKGILNRYPDTEHVTDRCRSNDCLFLFDLTVCHISVFSDLSIKKTKIFLRSISRKGERVENWKPFVLLWTTDRKNHHSKRERNQQIFGFPLAYGRTLYSSNSIIFLDKYWLCLSFSKSTLLCATSLRFRKVTGHVSHTIFHWPSRRTIFLNERWSEFTPTSKLIRQ